MDVATLHLLCSTLSHQVYFRSFEFFLSAPECVPISDSAETLGNPRWRCQLSVSNSKNPYNQTT